MGDSSVPEWCAFWVHHGWVGALRVDCHTNFRSPPCDELLNFPQCSASPDSETPRNDLTEKEASWCICDRWLFNADDEPSVGPDGPNEKDGVLVNESHLKYAHLNNYDLIIHCCLPCLDICSRGCPCIRRMITSD